AARRVGVHRLDPVERRGGVGELARAVVEGALAPPDTAEIETKDREAALREHVVELVDDLVVHRPAELRVRMKDDGDGPVLLLGGLETPFEAAGRPGEDHFWHCPCLLSWRRRNRPVHPMRAADPTVVPAVAASPGRRS